MAKEKIKKNRLHKIKNFTAFDVFLYALFILLALITIFPMYNVVILSFANTTATAANVPYLFPHVFDTTAYQVILSSGSFYRSVGVSLFVTIVGTGLSLLMICLGGYALSRKNLVGRNFFFIMILFTMFFGGGMVPTYLVIMELGLLNNIWVMILPSLVNTTYIIIMRNYFTNSIPKSIEDAARIDGASDFRILFTIFIPISKPILATLMLFTAVGRWNSWWEAYMYIDDTKLYPLQIFLRNVLVTSNTQLNTQALSQVLQDNLFSQGVQMAAIVVSVIPIMIVYPYLQKYYTTGAMVGSIKG